MDDALHEVRLSLAALRLYRWSNDDFYGRYTGVRGEIAEGVFRVSLQFARDRSNLITHPSRHGPMFRWETDADRLKDMKAGEFNHLSGLLRRDRTSYEDQLLTAIYWFADAVNIHIENARDRNKRDVDEMAGLEYFRVGERFLKLFVALESVLLLDPKEATTRNVADRAAFLLATEASGRKEISETVRQLARLRGDIVHRGDTFVTKFALEYLTQLVQTVIIELLRLNRVKGIRTGEACRAYLEERIYG